MHTGDDSMKKKKTRNIFEWLIYMIGYALILLFISTIFKQTVFIDISYFGFWSLLASIIIYLLNKTIKPLIVWLTLPVTGLTFGLFYPFINVVILNIVDFILGNHFDIQGIWMSFLVAILISLMNFILNNCVMKLLLGGKK